VPSSGTTSLEFAILDYVEEAYERCGLEARNGYELRTAIRSLNILAQEWANRGINLWTVEERSVPIVAGTSSYTLPADVIDILEFKIRAGSGEQQSDQSLSRISMPSWAGIALKNQSGSPSQIYVERKTEAITVKLWPVPSADSTMVYWCLRRIHDVTGVGQSFDAPMRFVPALIAGLAFHIAMKKSPERAPALQEYYEGQFAIAADEDRDRSDWRVAPSFS